MRLRIRGQHWKLKFVPFLGASCGICDYEKRELRIAKGHAGRDLLDTLVHETLHAAMPDVTEAAVASTAEAVASVLWKVGYRRPE